MRYEIDEKILKNHYNDLIKLTDWIPGHVNMYLPPEISLKLGSKVRNKDLWWRRIMHHKVHNETYNWESLDEIWDWEDERFMEKYPQFAYLFIKVDP